MRHQLKSKTPSAAARLRYITRVGSYAVGLDGPRMDLRATGNANLPIWAAGDATEFWSAADAFERANARRCLELELGLPRELTLEQQIAAVRDYIARLPIEMPMSWAIHDAGDGNPHVHLMIQERPLDDHARTAETWFKRANRQHPEKGGAIKSTWWHDRENVFYSRALWADACNVALINGGHEARFDARRKSVRLDEALRAGDLRAAALLTTLTERHEGHAVAGMRRRWERLEVELDELPDYAQQIIVHNDRVRAHNNQVRDWARTASESALRAYLSAELAELREQLATENPGAHVGAWIAHAHNLDRQRGVALAVEAGELELLTGAQIEAAERAAVAAELAALATAETFDIVRQRCVIEIEQAHAAALVEDAQRAGLLHGLHMLCSALDELRERDPAAAPAVRAALDEADRLLNSPPPSPALGARLGALEGDYRQMLADERRRRAEALRRAEEQARAQREAEARQHAEQERQAALDRQRELARRAVEQAEAQRKQVIERARGEYRAADRRVVEARTALQSAQGVLEYQQRQLAGVPALQAQRAELFAEANGHAAAVKLLRAERAAWLADHPVRSRAGLTGPADALLEQETRRLEVYERLAAQVGQIDSRIRSAQPAVEQAQRAVDAAQTALREAEARADQRFDDAGGPDVALRNAGLAQPEPLRERFAEGLKQMQQRLDDDQAAGRPAL